MASSRSVPQVELRGQALSLETAVLQAGLASRDELDLHKPGRPANPQTGARGWLRYPIVLQRRHARLEFGGGPGPAARPTDSSADVAITEVLRGKPQVVPLLVPEGCESPPSVTVYAKSFTALIHLHTRHRRIAWLQDHAQALQARPEAEALELYERIVLQAHEEHLICCWIATAGGVRLPYDEGDFRPTAPAFYRGLDPLNIHRINEAFQLVNGVKLLQLPSLLGTNPQAEAGRKVSWSVFFGAAAMELGVRPEVLMSDWSLGEVLAASSLAAEAKRDAVERAKAASPPASGR